MLADIIILAAILLYCGFVIVRRYRNRNNPGAGCCGCTGCSGGCAGCASARQPVSKGSHKK
ncbi:MAG TPA: FeoB-associated Cys-rich membrane protein [Candidatus Caccovicinus merdipullorum]|uniref:FeoB-associated Cys-rich membrane protein n=1 Tax=Candidatus Caccovicinus merdipullorum TaxID=2840724 RepID=A0A9D1GJC7_9FIRM|nr:FeoB-associated Cys-rich membrane protein [Candidatus Caccovicinus merdipullorum]